MSNQITLLNAVDGIKDAYKVLVRVTWQWRHRSSYSLSRSCDMEMILADQEGYKIHATINKTLISRFENLLIEGFVYYISNFDVAAIPEEQLKIVSHPHKVMFNRHTKVKKFEGAFQGPMFGFTFTDYKAIINFDVPDNLAIDVIGTLHSCGKILDKTISDRKSKVLQFELQSLDGAVLECSVWDKLAEQLDGHAQFHTNSDPIVVIIHLGRVTEFKEHAHVTNCFYGTRLFLDADLLEASCFRNDFLSRKKNGPPHTVAAFIDKATYSLVDDFVRKSPRKKLTELRDINTTGKYVAVTNITTLKLEPAWYYLSFNKCLGGVEEDDGEYFEEQPGSSTKAAGKWKCNKCKLRGVDAIRRYAYCSFPHGVNKFLHHIVLIRYCNYE